MTNQALEIVGILSGLFVARPYRDGTPLFPESPGALRAPPSLQRGIRLAAVHAVPVGSDRAGSDGCSPPPLAYAVFFGWGVEGVIAPLVSARHQPGAPGSRGGAGPVAGRRSPDWPSACLSPPPPPSSTGWADSSIPPPCRHRGPSPPPPVPLTWRRSSPGRAASRSGPLGFRASPGSPPSARGAPWRTSAPPGVRGWVSLAEPFEKGWSLNGRPARSSPWGTTMVWSDGKWGVVRFGPWVWAVWGYAISGLAFVFLLGAILWQRRRARSPVSTGPEEAGDVSPTPRPVPTTPISF